MSHLLHHRLFAILAAWLVIAGVGAQAIGRLSPLHCEIESHGCCESSSQQDQPEGSEDAEGCPHAICHHGFTAVLESMPRLTVGNLLVLELLVLTGTFPSEVAPVGIDHPPQLG